MQDKVVRANLTRMIREERLFDKRDHVLVAVSGGQDSLHVLRWLTDNSLPADIQPIVSAAYINHQLRTDADAEQALVERVFAQTPNLASKTIRQLTWDAVPTTGVEELAREKRYEALVARGSRLTQLLGMAKKQQLQGDIDLIRPVLQLDKAMLGQLVNEPLVEWVEDYTNADETFARNRVRHTVVPALEEINEQTKDHVIAFADQLAALQKLASGSINVHVKALEDGRLDWRVDESVLLLVLQTWLTKKHVFAVKDSQLTQAIQLMRNPNVNRGFIDLGNGLQLERFENYLLLSRKE